MKEDTLLNTCLKGSVFWRNLNWIERDALLFLQEKYKRWQDAWSLVNTKPTVFLPDEELTAMEVLIRKGWGMKTILDETTK